MFKTMQQIFTAGVLGIIKQGAPSIARNGVCLYRDGKGNKCIIGHSIPDESYTTRLEQRSAGESAVINAVGMLQKDGPILNRMQRLVHDNAARNSLLSGKPFLPMFLEDAREFAKANNLEMPNV